MTQQAFRNEILPLFEETRAEFLERARETAIRIAENDPQRICTVDMVRSECPPPPGSDPRVMGAVFQCHGPTARWEKVGYAQSQRKACHGRPISVFRLKVVTDRERTHSMLSQEPVAV